MAIDDNTIYGLSGAQIKDIAEKIEEKQDELVAGEGVTITDESGSLVISAEGTTYTAGDGIDITNDVIKATNTGKARELTSTDYNWPVANPDGVALWLLEPGVYYAERVQVYMSGNEIGDITNRGTFIVGDDSTISANPAKLILYYDQTAPAAYLISTVISSGNRSSKRSLLSPTVTQTTGTSTTNVMSQDAVTKFLKNNSSAGSIGVVYDTGVPKPIATSGTYSSSTGSSVILSPSWTYGCGDDNIIIGNNQAGPSSYKSILSDTISIGNGAHADYRGSIALGSYSQTSAVGEMNIGSTLTSDGYNSSNYRLLTGLYDPQSAHDAATKGYCDNALSGKQDALTAGDNITIEEESGALVISATGGGSSVETFTTNEWNALWA